MDREKFMTVTAIIIENIEIFIIGDDMLFLYLL